MVQEAERVTYPGWTVVKLLGEGSFGGVYEIERILPDGTVERAALKKADHSAGSNGNQGAVYPEL